MLPFLNYYGSKTNMTKTILDNFPRSYSIYLEPFGGGGSVLFAKKPVGMEVYNDLEENVWSIFKVLQDKEMFERFHLRISLTPYSREVLEESKRLLKTDLSLEDRAYHFFIVSRMSFNGTGGFSICKVARRDMVKSVSDYLSKVDLLPEYYLRLRRVLVEHMDALDLMEKFNDKEVFAYCDPPYVHDTRKSSVGYRLECSNEQHEKFVEACNNFKGKLLISGYDNPIYDNLKGFEKIHFESPNAHSDSIETLWANYPLKSKGFSWN